MPSATRRASGAALKLRPGESTTFTLPVMPRTKKNSRVHAKVRGRTVPLPSEAYKKMVGRRRASIENKTNLRRGRHDIS